MTVEDFDEFLKQRRILMAKKMKSIITLYSHEYNVIMS